MGTSTFGHFYTRTYTQTQLYASLLDTDPSGLSTLASCIAAPEMKAELLSLSRLLSVETHTCTETPSAHMPVHIHYSSDTTATNSSPRISLSLPAHRPTQPHELLRRTLWHDSDNAAMMQRAPTTLSTSHDTPNPLPFLHRLFRRWRSMFSSLPPVFCLNQKNGNTEKILVMCF